MSINLEKRYEGLNVSHYVSDERNITEWYNLHDIPNELRQGETMHMRGINWDHTAVEEWDEYVPTDTEEAIIQANIRARKEAADVYYTHVPDEVLDSVARVVDHAMENMNYDHRTFDRISVEDMSTFASDGLFGSFEIAVAKPSGPGHVTRINSRALDGGNARPNAVEKMKHKAMVDGFDMMFPAEAMIEYMNYVLANPFMDRYKKWSKAHDADWYDLVEKAKMFVSAMVDSSGQENEVNFKSRTDLDDDRQMLDRNNTKVPDNIHLRNVAAIKEFCAEKPEYVVALFMWTHAMTEYCRDLKSYVRTEMGPNQQEIAKEAPFWDVIGLVEGGNREMKHFVTLEPGEKRSNIDQGNKVVPTIGPNSFFYLAPVISGVMGALLEQSGITYKDARQRDITADAVKPALDKLVLSGIFQRGAGTETTPVHIRCPFAKKLREMLTLDLGGKGDPKDGLFMKFVEKVRADLQSGENNASSHMEYIIGNKLKKMTKPPRFGKSIIEKLNEHEAEGKKSKCPMHHKL